MDNINNNFNLYQFPPPMGSIIYTYKTDYDNKFIGKVIGIISNENNNDNDNDNTKVLIELLNNKQFVDKDLYDINYIDDISNIGFIIINNNNKLGYLTDNDMRNYNVYHNNENVFYDIDNNLRNLLLKEINNYGNNNFSLSKIKNINNNISIDLNIEFIIKNIIDKKYYDKYLFNDIKLLYFDNYLNISRNGIGNDDVINSSLLPNLLHTTWQYGYKIDHTNLLNIVNNNDISDNNIIRQEAIKILSQEYKIVIQPKSKYKYFIIEYLLKCWYADVDLTFNIKNIKFNLNNNDYNNLPSIIIYPRYGKNNAINVIKILSKYLLFLDEKLFYNNNDNSNNNNILNKSFKNINNILWISNTYN